MSSERGYLLVVDDDEMNRDMLSRRLRRKGYAVDVAVDGAAALAAIGERDYELVLLDIMMPGIDGLQVLERLRGSHSAVDLPIIMATAKDASEDVVRALEMGANDYVTKPLDFPVVLARVGTHLALKRAKEEVAEAHARMARDLETAARIQESLLPSKPPRMEGIHFAWAFEPCDELAGDIFDVFQLDDDRVGFYLLDVSGHGVPSALLSVTVSRLMANLDEGSILLSDQGPLAPAEVAAKLNARFPMNPETAQYFTVLYGIVDVSGRELRWVSAAHPGPVHLRAGADPRCDDSSGLAIGWFPQATYTDSVLPLEGGDRLYLYSDGIVEAPNEEEAEFGSERLMEVLNGSRASSLEESLAEVVRAVREWCGEGGPKDDISLLALEIPDS